MDYTKKNVQLIQVLNDKICWKNLMMQSNLADQVIHLGVLNHDFSELKSIQINFAENSKKENNEVIIKLS